MSAMASKKSQKITCKAAVCWAAGAPMVMEDIIVDPPGVSEVRVRMLYASICHTDILFSSGEPFQLFPRVLGHEGVGTIESVGEGVTWMEEGDVVIPTFVGECGQCRNCKSERTNACVKHPMYMTALMPDGTSRMSAKGEKLYHTFTCSTFSEFTVLDCNYLVKMDPGVHLQHASILSCGFSTGLGAAVYEAKVEAGSTAAVFGLGGVGIGAVAGARLLGAEKVIGVDLNDQKKDKATKFGMTHFINPANLNGKSVSEAIVEVTDGEGVDYGFECTGNETLINQVMESTAIGRGTTIAIGVPSRDIPLSPRTLFAGRKLQASIFGGIKPRSHFPTIFSKCISKEIQLDGIITHEVEFANINQAFELIKQPDCFKVLIKFTHP